MLSQVFVGFKVLVALVAIIVVVIMLLVPLHVLFVVEMEVTLDKRALDLIRVLDCQHDELRPMVMVC